jgi:hypothetical protein
LKLGEVVSHKGHGAGPLWLVEKLLLVVVQGLAVGLYSDADEHTVSEAEANDVGDITPTLRGHAPAGFGFS